VLLRTFAYSVVAFGRLNLWLGGFFGGAHDCQVVSQSACDGKHRPGWILFWGLILGCCRKTGARLWQAAETRVCPCPDIPIMLLSDHNLASPADLQLSFRNEEALESRSIVLSILSIILGFVRCLGC